MALDDYFSDPSQDCLARLFDAVNSMDISHTPKLSRYEKLIMRTSERKDLFIEKYEDLMRPRADPVQGRANAHRASDSVGSHSSFEEGILMRTRDDKGKGKEVPPSSPAAPTPGPGGDGDDDDGGKGEKKHKNYKHLIKAVPGTSFVLHPTL